MKFFNNGKTIIHYEDYSSHNNDVICFSNSLGTDNRIWHKILDYFIENFRVITYDKRGHGLSNKPDTKIKIEDLALDISDLLDHLGISKVNFVGISIGGMVAQKLAVIKPNLINKLILCDTAVKIGNLSIWNERIELLEKKGLIGIADSIIERWFSKKFILSNYEEIQIYKNMLTNTSIEGYIKCCEAIKNEDLSSTTELIKKPTLVLVGSDDKSTPPAIVKSTADLIKNSKFNIIKDSGHLPCVDSPDKFAKLIKNFIL